MQYLTYERNHSIIDFLQGRFESIYFNVTYTLCGKSKKQNKTIKHISLSIIYAPEFNLVKKKASFVCRANRAS